jgi:predicted enzyme related to lactoylglutathione lyase
LDYAHIPLMMPTTLRKMVTYANFYDPDGNRLQVAGPPPKT